MKQISEILTNGMTQSQILSVIISISIMLLFKMLSSVLSKIIIKIFKLNGKQKVTKSSFYKPLKTFIALLGIYIALMILKEPFKINDKVIQTINILFRISVIIVIAKGFIQGLTTKSVLIRRLQEKISPEKAEQGNETSIEFLIKITKAIIYVIAGVLIIQELGYDLKALIAGLGIGGVILTLAAQDTAKNLIGGVVIFLDKPFKIGDYIEVLNYTGTIENITFRSTAIRTLDDTVLHIPNSEISLAVITNWSELNRRRYKTNLSITMETPLEKVEQVRAKIEVMLTNATQVLEETVNVKFENIAQNGFEIVVIAYFDIVDYSQFLKIKQEINYNIMQILEQNKVQLAYNTQTVYVKN